MIFSVDRSLNFGKRYLCLPFNLDQTVLCRCLMHLFWHRYRPSASAYWYFINGVQCYEFPSNEPCTEVVRLYVQPAPSSFTVFRSVGTSLQFPEDYAVVSYILYFMLYSYIVSKCFVRVKCVRGLSITIILKTF